jgi:hypothetical protein
MVTAEGGKLVNTPTYEPEDNFQNRFTTVSLSPEGTADINIKTDYGACQYEENLGMTLIEPTDIEERLVLKASQSLSEGGDKLFLTLNMLNRNESVPRKIENRKTSFSLPYGFKDMDEIVYTLPKGYKAEFIPRDVLLESEFGKYTAKAVIKDNTIVYTRTQLINSKKYPLRSIRTW